jgi:predicted nucleic acid-binding protein
MIVVDTNVVAYLLLGGEKTGEARMVFHKDPTWAAPLLWRSEFRNDCEFVALAQQLDVPLVTSDAQLLKAFPQVAVSLDAFTRER